MQKLALPAIFLLVIILIIFSAKPEILVRGGTKVGELNLGYLTKEQADSKVYDTLNKPLYFNLVNQSTSQSYQEIGVSYDKTVLNGYLAKCFFKFFCLNLRGEKKPLEQIITLDESQLDNLVEGFNNHLQNTRSSPFISFDDITFYAPAPDGRSYVDKNDLLSQLTAKNIFSKDPLKIKIVEEYQGSLGLQNQKTYELLEEVTSQPLLVKYGRQPIYVSSADLKKVTKIISEDGINKITVDETEVKKLIDGFKEKYSLDIKVDEFYAIRAIQYAFLFRAGDEQLNTAVILPLIGDPRTDGKVANKYVEINKSQQRLYTFENGEVTNVYVVGTGLTAETPSGDFKILRKSRMSYSYFGNWYLPYMMPVGQFPNGLYFGIHEIPYHQDGAGNIYSRDENTMGSPATGGCIQMYREDVVELWNWVDIGTPVIITD